MDEISVAEIFILKSLQKESFAGIEQKNLSTLNPFEDKFGVIRLKTRISSRDDDEHFRFPVLLPAKHPIVTNIIFDTHVKQCHVGTQGLMSILRENFWILGGRRAIKSAISRCCVCKRHNGKPFNSSVVPLPLDRVRDAAVFEITGVDFAGPLHLKGEKAWVCLYTCAVYRAVHFELCTSLSASNFMQALRRFISRRGRPKTMYSDNGTNFVGTDNAFEKLDWNKILADSSVYRITWRFNPPTASWWGGFWERLVGMLKQLLRKTLGRTCLSYEELTTVLCDCEMVINSRPLTYVSTDATEMEPISPIMFLQERAEYGVLDLDLVDGQSLCRRVAHQKRLREELRRRFRSEYLGQLKSFQKGRPGRNIKLKEVVLIGNDTQKRLDWPLGRVTELLTGKDNQVRLVKLTTARGQILRPIQRLYTLECVPQEVPEECIPIPSNDFDEDKDCSTEPLETNDKSSGNAGVKNKSRAIVPLDSGDIIRVTHSGRTTRKPRRFL